MNEKSYPNRVETKPKLQLLEGDCLTRLKTLPDRSAHCCITSPPYYSQRAYGTEPVIFGGKADCEHQWAAAPRARTKLGVAGNTQGQYAWKTDISKTYANCPAVGSGQFCHICGAWRGELGHEPTAEAYVQNITSIIAEVHRVLRKDGVLFLNLGDTFVEGDLLGVPWQVAFALKKDGWSLRSDTIWYKPTAMPEPVQNRPSRAHEYVFLFAKSKKYFFDATSIREPRTSTSRSKVRNSVVNGDEMGFGTLSATRNSRTVWTFASQPYRGSHLAPMPLNLVKHCMRAGTSAGGCCARCGSPRIRAAKHSPVWQASCTCSAPSIPCTVLDPFAGVSTTLLAAGHLGRSAIGIELSPDYCRQGAERVREELGIYVPILTELTTQELAISV